ncbi:MAG: hypothetical protein RR472_03950, partial [Anaerovoracaceae bacterium]
MRKKIIRILSSILFLTIIMTAMPMEAFASIWTFGTTGQGNNPFTPRGYLVDTGTGQTWLRSGFDNSGPVIQYTGAINGTGFIAAANPDGSNYTFY